MPSIEENRVQWGEKYEWQDGGDEWSHQWGSPKTQWFYALYPRLEPFLPSATILEIAPGFGRWTEFLLDHCDRLVGVDLNANCVEECRRRFSGHPSVSFHVNDGRSLPMVADKSIDLAFSFDSLVHVEADVIADYLGELARVLNRDGVGFLHHSNLGQYRRSVEFTRPALQGARRRFLDAAGPRHERQVNRIFGAVVHRAGLGEETWRALSVNAEIFADLCGDAGLRCVSQELVTWGSAVRFTDCISVVARGDSTSTGSTRVVKNRGFWAAGGSARLASSLYAKPGVPVAR
jgi:ubiquinone/menaquinone biosynthesis C-methylase UbiE